MGPMLESDSWGQKLDRAQGLFLPAAENRFVIISAHQIGGNERRYVERKWTKRKPAVTTWVPRKEVRFERRRNTRHSNTDICRS